MSEVCRIDPFGNAALSAIGTVRTAETVMSAVEALRNIREAVGADCAIFGSFVRDDESNESFRFMIDGDLSWCLEYETHGWYTHDPWVLYAMNRSEPIVASRIPVSGRAQRAAVELAHKHGVMSAFVVPAPVARGSSRVGALVLGSKTQGYFEGAEPTALRVYARSASMELNEWWIEAIKREVRERAGLSDEDLLLLRCERDGVGSKKIGELMGLSASAVDSRFQRLNARLEVPTRRAGARLAAELGLI